MVGGTLQKENTATNLGGRHCHLHSNRDSLGTREQEYGFFLLIGFGVLIKNETDEKGNQPQSHTLA